MENKDPRWPLLDQQDMARINELINSRKVDFPTTFFPKECQDVINYFANNLELNKDFCSVGVLSALSSAIGLKTTIKTDYVNAPIFWIAIVAESGYGKTPPLDKALEPLRNLDKKGAQEYNRDKAAHLAYPATTPKPILKQRIVNNFTIEALIDVHKFNPNGLLIYADELMGFIQSFGAYKAGKSGEQEQYLSMHDGGMVCVNRKSSDPIVLEKTCVSILGGIQPSKLTDFLSDGRSDDGFLYRFLFVYQPENKKNSFQKTIRDKKIEQTYLDFIQRLAITEIKTECHLNEKAEQVFIYWQSQCQEIYFEDKAENGFQKKLVKQLLRLALISHSSNKNTEEICASTFIQAIQAVEFFRRNFIAMMEDLYEEQVQNRSSLMQKVLSELPKGEFSRADALPVFQKYLFKDRTIHNKLNNRQYFIKVRQGVYQKRQK